MPGPIGRFIVVEGPNGVGKTTVCDALVGALRAARVNVHGTAEPSRATLGGAIREIEASLTPEALALACAADRMDHIAREIRPHMAGGGWVVCDRYVPSSLVLQRIDGLDIEWIWTLNRCAVQPDLIVYLDDDPETIDSRLTQRGRRSRFEFQGSSARELDYYRQAYEFLAHHGWRQKTIDCRSRTPREIVKEIQLGLQSWVSDQRHHT